MLSVHTRPWPPIGMRVRRAVELHGNGIRSADDANTPISPAALVRWAGEEHGAYSALWMLASRRDLMRPRSAARSGVRSRCWGSMVANSRS
jgi:hypothetical protein